MLNLEQIKLLETKVTKAVEYVDRLTKENATLLQREVEFQAKIDTYQGRIDELEVLLMRFSEDQGQIEEGILAALDKLSQFEKEMEKSLKEKSSGFHAAATKAAAKQQTRAMPAPHHTPAQEAPAQEVPAAHQEDTPAQDEGQTCFEIPEGEHEGDVLDPLGEADETNDAVSQILANAGSSPAEDKELDIF